jgi:hypothetical protein
MASFTFTIVTDNAAFEDGNLGDEIARIMREVAERVERGDEHGICRDVNGNRVGSFGTTGSLRHLYGVEFN